MENKTGKKYNTYLVKEGDTLASISKKIEKTQWEVAHFHNIYAKHEELIGIDFPKNLTQLYISSFISEKKLDNVPKVSFIYDGKIELKPQKQLLKYQVTSELSKGEESTTLSYEMSVLFMEKKHDKYLFQINKTTPFKEQDSFTMLEELEAKISDALYPLELYVDNYGSIHKIANYETIKKRWLTVKEALLDNFEGNAVVKNIAFYDPIFDSEVLLNKVVDNDVFLKSYFSGLHSNYSKSYYYIHTINFPILQSIKNPDYQITSTIDPYLNENNTISIERQGQVADKRVKQDFIEMLNEPYYAIIQEDSEKAKGNFIASYVFDSKTHTIVEATVKCDIELEMKRAIKVTIQVIE